MAELSFAGLADGRPVKIDLDGTPVCVTRIGDEVFAIADTCSHSDASLSEGDVTGFKIECGCMALNLIFEMAKLLRHQLRFR